MNLNEIKELIKAVDASSLTVFDYREGNITVTLRKDHGVAVAGNVAASGIEGMEMSGKKQVNPSMAGEASLVSAKEDSTSLDKESNSASGKKVATGNIVKSPLVGTAYMAPEEGAKPYVAVGDHVKKGQVLAIVEAMKLMNEIESEYDGVVKEILVSDGEAVEYGQGLFVIG